MSVKIFLCKQFNLFGVIVSLNTPISLTNKIVINRSVYRFSAHLVYREETRLTIWQYLGTDLKYANNLKKIASVTLHESTS